MCASAPLNRQQNPPGDLPCGTRIAARGWPWRLARTWRGEDCAALEIEPLSRDAPRLAVLLDPFDRVRPLAVGPGWRRATPAKLRQWIATLKGAWPDQPLAALARLHVPLWPHQTTPALALLQGRGCRVLVADDVGLGKTLAAALVMAELTARGLCRRGLIIVPAGLRDQWRQELRDRAGLHADVVDLPALAGRVRLRPAGQSPWTAPGLAIVSVDFAKQPLVLAGLAAWPWDVLVVDEAHQVSTDSARAAAVGRVARCSRVVLLLTATPHSGDAGAFRRLLAIGGDGPPALWVRRQRGEVDATRPPRRTRRWRVRPTADESRLLDALAAYARRVDRAGGPEARLAMVVLRKRALSSAAALARSLEHRRAALGGVVGEQLLLPLESLPGEHDIADDELPPALVAPGLDDRAGEIATLDALIDRAQAASSAAAKWRSIDRLLGRTSEPLILYTEYRDTLRALVAHLDGRADVVVLHGGLDRAERTEAVARFTAGDARVLVATDAAAEGLNLHARCRLVVNVELPWSPRVLEQRAGRVDRIGQHRQVHVWELAGHSGHEGLVAAALARRAEAIRTDLSGNEPEDIEVPAPLPPEGEPGDGVDRRTASAAQVWWRLLRQLADLPQAPADPGPASTCVWRHAKGRLLGRGALLIVTRPAAAAGDSEQHVAVFVRMSRLPAGSPNRWLPAVVEAARPVVASALASSDALTAALRRREEELSHHDAAVDTATRRWQPSFFDRRADRVVDAARRDLARLAAEHEQRRTALQTRDQEPLIRPVLALLVR